MKKVMDRIKYFSLCVLAGLFYLIFAVIVAVRKSQYSTVDSLFAISLPCLLVAWFLLTTALVLFWPRRGAATSAKAATFDLLFYAFLPITVGGVCAVRLLGEASLVRIFIAVAALKGLSSLYWLANCGEDVIHEAREGTREQKSAIRNSPFGRIFDPQSAMRWPTILMGTILTVGVLVTLVAIGGQTKRLTGTIKLKPDTSVTSENRTLSVDVKEGTRASQVRLRTALVHSGELLQNTKIGALRVVDKAGDEYEFAFRVGVHVCEKCYEIPNTREHVRHLRSGRETCGAEFLAHGQAYLGRTCSATFGFGKEIEPRTIELSLSIEDPKYRLLRIYVKEILLLADD